MAVTSRGRTELQIPKKWKDRETSPERTKIWTEPRPKTERKVPVVYYLSRNGHLEHPHFMEVPLSSSEGLYLRDVINRLNVLRGKGMPSMYSWSSKRSYKNGFVWHDLSENDFIYPAHGQEYVLKGSELLESSSSFRSPGSSETVSPTSEKPPEVNKPTVECDFPVVVRRRNQSWSSIDLHEYKVYKTESTGECAGKAADASTQTDDKRRRRRIIREEEVQEKAPPIEEEQYEDQSTELSREEISPPPSSSSPETLESLIKADGHLISRSGGVEGADIRDQTANISSSGRMKASAVLMQLISCGTISIKDCSTMPSSGKDQGFSLISHYRARIPRGASNQVTKEVECLMENPSYGGVRLEDKEYFSGSLVETKKDEFPALKRSSSYNADRSSKLDLADKEIEGVRAKCIPRKPKTPGKKESNDVSRSSIHGSKRHGDEPVINQID
ncbi:PREDICTED: protein UPSTREAM OF FLC [Nelumbo nucifera]|uniref:Protein UPSTREAM OF FLC n=1 Tax=Nelumbo nucifera TaxID=4432 RepID=A0A1U7ZHI6_NELNU|nr:PREDICTED: protein UPSTREAM OF FLC [Nelumbo nucifera]